MQNSNAILCDRRQCDRKKSWYSVDVLSVLTEKFSKVRSFGKVETKDGFRW